MKVIMLLILIFILFSCEDGPVTPTVVIDSKEDALKQEMRLKKRFENIHKARRNIAKAEISKQVKKRQFIEDTKELDQTDEEKISYYLNIAIKASEQYRESDATRYAKKVLELDPKNIEAKKILRKIRAFHAKIKRYERKFEKENDPHRNFQKMQKEIKAIMKEDMSKYTNYRKRGSAGRIIITK